MGSKTSHNICRDLLPFYHITIDHRFWVIKSVQLVQKVLDEVEENQFYIDLGLSLLCTIKL